MGTDAVMLKALEMAKAQLSNYKTVSANRAVVPATQVPSQQGNAGSGQAVALCKAK